MRDHNLKVNVAQRHRVRAMSVAVVVSVFMSASAILPVEGFSAGGKDDAVAQGVTVTSGSSNGQNTVSIEANSADLVMVLKALSRQAGKNIVIGPEVTNSVNVRLKDMSYDQALDVMLRSYGYGFDRIGETYVVNRLENLAALRGVEPTSSRVYTLSYLDASDVKAIISSMLSPRGQFSALTSRGQVGWRFESGGAGARNSSGGGGSSATASLGKRERAESKAEDAEKQRSKTIIVTDINSVLDGVTKILSEIDRRPTQILIEARLVEVSKDRLKDLGIELFADTIQAGAGGVNKIGAKSVSSGVKPSAFDSRSGAAGKSPFDAGMQLMFSRLTDGQWSIFLHALEEDAGANILSAPRVMTLNNQEATIIVGTKFPIISTDVGSGNSSSVSTSLDYYENIGIQLNVVPQMCDEKYIRLVVHPAVTDQIGTASARTGSGSDIPLTEFPILSTREAETQILTESGQTIVIGGLLEDAAGDTAMKVPVLGNIPYLGRLFRRDTNHRSKLDLMIFLTATVVNPDEQQARHDIRDELDVEKEDLARERANVKKVSDANAASERELRTAREALEKQKGEIEKLLATQAATEARLKEAADRLAAERARLEKDRSAALKSAKDRGEDAAADSSARSKQLDTDQRAVAQQREALEADRKELERLRAESAGKLSAVQAAQQALLGRQRDIEAREAKLNAAIAAFQARQDKVDKLAEEQAAKEAKIAASQKRFEEAQAAAEAERKIAEKALAEKRKQLDAEQLSLAKQRELATKDKTQADALRAESAQKRNEEARAAAEAGRKALEAELADKRKQLEADKRALAEQSAIALADRKKAEELRVESERKLIAMQDAQKAATAQQSGLNAREEQLNGALQALETQKSRLDKQAGAQADLAAKFEEAQQRFADARAASEKERKAREAAIDERVKQLEKDQLELAAQRKIAAADWNDLQKMQAQVEQKGGAIQTSEKQLVARQRSLDERQKSLDEREKALGRPDANAGRGTTAPERPSAEDVSTDASLAAERAKLAESRKEIATQEQALAQQRKELEQQKKSSAEILATLENRRLDLDREAAKVEASRKAIAEAEKGLVELEKEKARLLSEWRKLEMRKLELESNKAVKPDGAGGGHSSTAPAAGSGAPARVSAPAMPVERAVGSAVRPRGDVAAPLLAGTRTGMSLEDAIERAKDRARNEVRLRARAEREARMKAAEERNVREESHQNQPARLDV